MHAGAMRTDGAGPRRTGLGGASGRVVRSGRGRGGCAGGQQREGARRRAGLWRRRRTDAHDGPDLYIKRRAEGSHRPTRQDLPRSRHALRRLSPPVLRPRSRGSSTPGGLDRHARRQPRQLPLEHSDFQSSGHTASLSALALDASALRRPRSRALGYCYRLLESSYPYVTLSKTLKQMRKLSTAINTHAFPPPQERRRSRPRYPHAARVGQPGTHTHLKEARPFSLARTRYHTGHRGNNAPLQATCHCVAAALQLFERVIVSTSHQLLRSVRRMLVMPVSGPWYECVTSLSISSAVRLSPGANGWFHAVKMYSSGSGQEC